ncbi:ADP-ribosylglycohydrolase family protein [Aquabacterium sp. A7-Y]|uniref:ADP-ribosylglycohydrolase family protein n=1 Tax=Aquabacterium sp. A7-Y TaxID=1349605 RepID=UPI00223D75D4|nr:ADP-ribosylglycohydrolase family protein [Aquabacterium sp. A7-Y]MCW7540631.1 ADP-ribosylglycohydrolase family protein [Aquabacterium sp. A7-Y]
MSSFVDPQKVRGTLLGLAWGDVFGCPVEYWSPAQIEAVYGRYEHLPAAYPLDRIPSDPLVRDHLRPLGLHSDDTQQALVLVHSCLHEDGWHVERWAEHLLQGQRRQAWRGTGRNFRSALQKMADGRPPLECGSATAGIGGAMRIAPLAALYSADLRQLTRVVVEATASTHADLRAVSFALAVAVCGAMLLQGRHDADIREELPAYVEEIEASLAQAGTLPVGEPAQVHAVSATLRRFLTSPWSGLAELRSALAESATGHGIELAAMESPVNHAFVLLGGVHALCVGLWPDDEPQSLLAELVQQGGDTDTVAAIAGGILGARFGTDWIPLERCMDAAMLEHYADSLLSGRLPEAYEDFIERERNWTVLERRYLGGVSGAA